ncbi:PREDICTED: uncharacterized protein LOC101299090 isoform X1 [Fragaria vesca subsp. vesca]|uniref:uncharacterized protein LOC101299090 isoform X1 n=1 Tax=Fragaria vesca subsp. vesca TaxID=101020 RepID=UPI0002C30223|nr:PREDICTED: uncharacterized protein LOC101299090 isoform X1 [Fragaria vesca subsp. vesca]
MEKKQQVEWAEAQKIVLSIDLVAEAKQQLQFLAVVDRNRKLHEGPALFKAIYRYKYCWLPLLAKRIESEVTEAPLVVPLDCEWIWHCHRLNPVCYVADCETLYGRILDNQNVVSSIWGTCRKQTEQIWNKLYPHEPYEVQNNSIFSDDTSLDIHKVSESTKYDLVSAVKRQISLFHQVSGAYVKNDIFLKEAVARYKGFLHLIKRNRQLSVKRFCVPTYDIDLIWHSHQLYPAAYCKDLKTILGKVLQHDDTDSDRTKGNKLDVAFSGTTKQWEETFGSRYWRAGAMYRGSTPSPLTINLSQLEIPKNKGVVPDSYRNVIQLPKRMLVEVMLEIVAVRNFPTEHKGSLFVSISKKQPDLFFSTRRRIDFSSDSTEIAVFQCQPTGELLFELMSCSSSVLPTSKSPILLGTSAITLDDLFKSLSKLQAEKWLEFMPNTSVLGSNRISLRIAFSWTTPIPSPYRLHMVLTHSSKSCFFSLSGRFQNAKHWACVMHEAESELMSIQMRELIVETSDNCLPKKEVIGTTPQGESHMLAEFVGTGWSLMNGDWFFRLPNKLDEEDHIFEIVGNRKVIILPGRKLEYETRSRSKQETEQNFLTAIEISPEYPYGKAVALVNVKSGFLEIKEEWLLLPWITSAFILSDVSSSGEGYDRFTATSGEKQSEFVATYPAEDVDIKHNEKGKRANLFPASERTRVQGDDECSNEWETVHASCVDPYVDGFSQCCASCVDPYEVGFSQCCASCVDSYAKSKR